MLCGFQKLPSTMAEAAATGVLPEKPSGGLPEDHQEAIVYAVTHGLEELPPGPELLEECAARRKEVWTIIGQLQQVLRFTEEAMKEEERATSAADHSHRLLLARNLLQGLARGAEQLERIDRGAQPAGDLWALEKEYCTIRNTVGGLHMRTRDICSQLASVAGRAALPDALLGAAAAPLPAAPTSFLATALAYASAATGPRCVRCGHGGGAHHCAVVIRSIYDVQKCKHGPYCPRCMEALRDRTVLPTCVCRALISHWLEEPPS